MEGEPTRYKRNLPAQFGSPPSELRSPSKKQTLILAIQCSAQLHNLMMNAENLSYSANDSTDKHFSEHHLVWFK